MEQWLSQVVSCLPHSPRASVETCLLRSSWSHWKVGKSGKRRQEGEERELGDAHS